MRSPRRFGSCESGVIVVEFAYIMPVMLVAMFGSINLTQLVRASTKLWTATHAISDLVAEQNTISTSQLADYCSAGSLILAPLAGTPKVTVASVTTSILGLRTVDWQDTSCSGTTMSNALSLGAVYTPNIGDSVIITQLTYTYTFSASFLFPASVTFTRLAYSRPRNGTQVQHS